MPTLTQLRTRIQSNWPSGYHSSDLDGGKINQFVNDTQRWICRGILILPTGRVISHNFSWMKQEATRNTVDEQRKYSLPVAGDSNWTEVESGTVRKFKSEVSCELIKSNSYRSPLIRRHKQNIENDPYFNNTAGYGIPEVYCIDQEYIWLYKLPKHSLNSGTAFVMNLEFYGYLADLSADDDTNILTNQYPEVLEYGATELGFRFGHNPEQAEYWAGKKLEAFLHMLEADNVLELTNIEEGMQPAAGQSLGGGQASTGFVQSTDWYNSV